MCDPWDVAFSSHSILEKFKIIDHGAPTIDLSFILTYVCTSPRQSFRDLFWNGFRYIADNTSQAQVIYLGILMLIFNLKKSCVGANHYKKNTFNIVILTSVFDKIDVNK